MIIIYLTSSARHSAKLVRQEMTAKQGPRSEKIRYFSDGMMGVKSQSKSAKERDLIKTDGVISTN